MKNKIIKKEFATTQTTHICLSLTPQQYERIKAAAAAYKMTSTVFIKNQILKSDHASLPRA